MTDEQLQEKINRRNALKKSRAQKARRPWGIEESFRNKKSARRRKVVMMSLDGKVLGNYASLTDAANYLVANKLVSKASMKSVISYLSKTICGQYDTAYGFKWKKL